MNGIPFAPIGVYGGRSHLRERISIIHNQLDPHIEYQEDNSTLIVIFTIIVHLYLKHTEKTNP